MMLLWLIPAYLLWRSVMALLYAITRRFGWNLRLFSADQEILSAFKLLYYARLLPNPFWDNKKKEKWASSWWIYGILGAATFYLYAGLSFRM